VMELTLALAGEMLYLGAAADSPAAGRLRAQEAIDSGAAFEKLVALVEAQGGDASVLDDPDRRDGITPVEVRAGADAHGYVAALDALALGRLAVRLGAGRLRKEDPVDPLAGLILQRKPGDAVAPGD